MNVLNNGLELTWLGHATWIMRTPGGKRLLFDPWLGNPKCPERYRHDGVGDLDAILVSHGHFDHVADLEAIAKSSGAPVVAIFDLTAWLERKGVTHAVGLNRGGTATVAGLKITLTPAVHSSSLIEDDGPMDLGDPCGFVIELENGFKVYNSGDTDVFGDMALIAELHSPDLAMLSIGDHFTMGPRGAAKAVELLRVKRVVPQHYGTFPLLSGTPEALQALVPPDVAVLVVEPGETLR
jgi:L-ascorbate metabolism protein UlaG (beta-lactamase superfamily)